MYQLFLDLPISVFHILFVLVVQLPLKPILANPHLVDQIHNVDKITVKLFALVSLATLELHLPVDQSVLLAQNVLKMKLVTIKNVLTHVLEHAE